VARLQQAGVRLRVIPPFEPGEMRTEYLPGSKRLEVGSRRLSLDTLLHELGHALDDLAAPDEPGAAVLRSQRDEGLQKLYADYCQRVGGLSWWQRHLGHQMWSDYATTSVQEYLAEGIMHFSRSQASRRRLERSDPELCRYLEEFLLADGSSASAEDAPAREGARGGTAGAPDTASARGAST
jgi:hypothetical protein